MNKQILLSVLQGNGSQAHREVVALNTAFVLWASGVENDFKNGLASALHSLNQGLPWKKILELKEFLDANAN